MTITYPSNYECYNYIEDCDNEEDITYEDLIVMLTITTTTMNLMMVMVVKRIKSLKHVIRTQDIKS